MKRTRKIRRDVHDPEWYFSDPKTRKWLVQCLGCQSVGYRVDAPEKFWNRDHLIEHFKPLDLSENGLCRECREAAQLDVKS